MNQKYDSKDDTFKHIDRVSYYIDLVQSALWCRAENHDTSKLLPPEKEIFDIYTPKLKAVTFGSKKYQGFLEAMKEALEHHYKVNRHHPQHFPNGIQDMNLVDLIEMLCDWMAASERHDDGDIMKSLDINAKRFNIPGPILALLTRTVKEIL